MSEIIDARDLEGVKITPLEPGGFFVSAPCPLCRRWVSLRLTAGDVGSRTAQGTECRSGGDWPRFFQLHARYSPEETDDSSGVDVWGLVERDVHNEEYD
ncbi:MAG: hypothetical protein WD940_00995 [Patescibacteria group bacterium]